MSSVGIEAMKNMYAGDEDFKEAYEVCEAMNERCHTGFMSLYYKIYYYLKESALCS